jgi:hypothetical protein
LLIVIERLLIVCQLLCILSDNIHHAELKILFLQQ